jgi:glutathionylspermidine synthase
MWRHSSRPRKGWRGTVVREGLIFPDTARPDGSTVPYWNEAAWYEFTLSQVEEIEAATETLWGMCEEAAARMAADLSDARLGLPEGSLAYARESLARCDPSVYARFDLRYDGLEPPTMLELNGDTPTGLVETGVAQWTWVEQVLPDTDQFNSLHDRLVQRWRDLAASGRIPDHTVHFLWSEADEAHEEEMTVHYMRDTAIQAGLTTYGQPIEHVRWHEAVDEATGRVLFRGFVDAMGQPITTTFKLYPWEVMLGEEFGAHLLGKREQRPVRWIEPAWKLLLSTKALLPVLWEMFPGHPNLVPAYFDEPRDLEEWVAKPLHGREGDNITLHTRDAPDVTMGGGYGAEGYVFQQYVELPNLDGNNVVLGSWIVDGQAAGMIVRESDGPITDYFSRVAPHAISDQLAPSPEQVQAWLRER